MERLNPFPKDEAERIIAKTVAVLDRYSKLYSQLSHGRFTDYSSYMASDGCPDEDEFIKPKLLTDFLREVLLFPPDEFVSEHAVSTGIPDFQPTDTLLHPFFFEAKGSDAVDLTQHQAQVSRYLKPPFEHGVLVNMRHILVYEKNGLEVNRIGLLDLYRAYRDQPKNVLDYPNTKAFLEFVSQFRRKDLTRETKVALLLAGKDVSLLPKPDPEELVAAIHRIVHLLVDDANRFKGDLERILKSKFNVDDRESVLRELDQIAWELDHRYLPAKDDRVSRYLNARAGSVEARAFDVFVTRVAYFTMTRFLVARMWEDVKFLEQRLYDGGFRRWYETLGRRIQEVLKQAFHYAGDRYSWLYGPHHNYFWYDPPSEETIVDVLYELARFNLGLLDADVLGTVYEQFVERVDRKNKGQYYTPREMIRFIWDRVGYTSEDAFFRFEEGGRTPKLVLDLATGSGGFLVEAAFRMRTLTRCSKTDVNEMLELLYSMMNGLWGCEISQFANYITEVNMLIQLTPLVRAIVDASAGVPRDLHAVKLMTAPGDSLALIGAGPLFNPNNNHFARDANRELIRHDPKGPVRELLTSHFDYDYVCSNPPYVGEKGHKELFRSTLESLPYWRRHYQGKMDYLYWFIILGLIKLREGGRLGFITTSYWPTADGATHLREFILENALILEIIDFGETRIFEGAPGQHNMVFVLEKCPSYAPNASHIDGIVNQANVDHKQKHRIKIVKVKAVPPAKHGDKRPPLARVIDHVSGLMAKAKHSDEYVDIHLSAETQGEFDGGPWTALRPSDATEKVVCRIEAQQGKLADCFESFQGIISSADRVISRNIGHLPGGAIAEHGIRLGDPIFLLTKPELASLGLAPNDRKLVKAFFQNVDLGSYTPEKAPWKEDNFLIYTTRDTRIEEFPGIERHLAKFRAILESKREARQGKLPWYSLHWPRDPQVFEGPKIVAPHYRYSHPFVFTDGSFYTSDENYVFKKKPEVREDEKYFVALLNSAVTDRWMTRRLTKKASGFEMLSQRLAFLPVHRINFEDKREVAQHDKLVKLVDEMIETKQALAKLNRLFGARLTRLTGLDELPDAEVEAVTLSLPDSALRRLRNHPKVLVKPEPAADFVLTGTSEIGDAADLFTEAAGTVPDCGAPLAPAVAKPHAGDCPSPAASARVPSPPMYAIRLTGKGRKTANVIAPKEILKYLQKVLPKFKGKTWPEIKEIPVARDLATYQAKEKEVVSEAKSLLRKVATVQSKIDTLVYELYGLTEDEIATIEGRPT